MNLPKILLAAILAGQKAQQPESVLAATAAMTPEQAAETVRNLGIPGAVYEGVDLTVKFADEIANHTDEWAWIKSRIQAGNYAGINVGDYIPVTADNTIFKARIMGIDSYTGSGDVEIGHHIDWIFEELWKYRNQINKANYNNGLIPVENVTADGAATEFTLTKEMNDVAKIESGGTELTGWDYDSETYKIKFEIAPAAGTLTVTGTGTEFPWLACDAYHYANSLAGQVPNGTGLNPAVTHVDYTQGGIYYRLPQMLKDAIIPKRAYLAKRYNATSELSAPNAGDFVDIGNIWFPTEFEVFGFISKSNISYDNDGSVQYPYFANNMHRVKQRNSARDGWWLLNAATGNKTGWVDCESTGINKNVAATKTQYALPVCFRT